MPRRRQGQYPRPFEVTLGPFTGVDDSETPDQSRTVLVEALNVARNENGVLEAAPRWSVVTVAEALLSGTNIRGMVGDATQDAVFFAAGNALLRGTTTVTPSGWATWATTGTGPIYLLGFAGQIIAARDGAIPQRLTNLSAGTLTMTAIALNVGGTETTTGMPTIYSGRVFFPITSDRATFVWSEPGDPSLGYQQAGYVNFWRFAQTSDAPLRGLWGTNSRLLVVRRGSIAGVYGQATADFATTATADDVGTALGDMEMTSFVQADDETWFIDGTGRVRVIPPAGPVGPPVPGMRRLTRAWQSTPGPWGAGYIADVDTVCFRVPVNETQLEASHVLLEGTGYDGAWRLIAVHRASRLYCGRWSAASLLAAPPNAATGLLGMANGQARWIAPSTATASDVYVLTATRSTDGTGANMAMLSSWIADPSGGQIVADEIAVMSSLPGTASSSVTVTLRNSPSNTASGSSSASITFGPGAPTTGTVGVDYRGRALAVQLGPGINSIVRQVLVRGFVDAPEPDVL